MANTFPSVFFTACLCPSNMAALISLDYIMLQRHLVLTTEKPRSWQEPVSLDSGLLQFSWSQHVVSRVEIDWLLSGQCLKDGCHLCPLHFPIPPSMFLSTHSMGFVLAHEQAYARSGLTWMTFLSLRFQMEFHRGHPLAICESFLWPFSSLP